MPTPLSMVVHFNI